MTNQTGWRAGLRSLFQTNPGINTTDSYERKGGEEETGSDTRVSALAGLSFDTPPTPGGLVNGLKQKALNFAKTQGASFVTTIKEPHVILQKTCVELDNLYSALSNTTQKEVLTPAILITIAGNLEAILKHESEILGASVDSSGKRKSLSTNEKRLINSLIQNLQNSDFHSDEPVLVASILNILREHQLLQLDPIGKVVEQFRRALGLTQADSVQSAQTSVLETDNQKRLMERIAPPPAKKKVLPDNLDEALTTQAALLKTNATRMAVGRFVLFSVCGIQDVGQLERSIGLNNTLQTDAETSFQQDIYAFIDTSNCSWIRRNWAKFCYRTCRPIFSFYVHHMVDKVIADIRSFIALDPTKKFSLIQTLSIAPTNNYLATLISIYSGIATDGKILDTSIETHLQNTVAKRPVDNQSSKTILARLAQTLVSKYLPPLDFCSRFDRVIAAWSPETQFQTFSTSVKTLVKQALWFVGIWAPFTFSKLVAGIFQTILNPIIRKILEKIIGRTLFPAVLSSTKNGLGVGGVYLHTVNTLIHDKLKELQKAIRENRLAEKSETHQISLHMQEPFRRLVQGMTRVLGLQEGSGDLIKIQQICKNESIELQLKETAINQVVDLATQQIVAFLQSFLQPKFLEELAFTSLETLNNQCSKPAEKISPTEIAAMEENMLKELKALLSVTISQGFEEVINPAAKSQRAADHFVDQFKKEINTFIQSAKKHLQPEKPTPKDLKALIAASEVLSSKVRGLTVGTKTSTDSSTYGMINNKEAEYLEQSEGLFKKIKEIKELATDYTDVDRHLYEIQTFKVIFDRYKNLPPEDLLNQLKEFSSSHEKFLGQLKVFRAALQNLDGIPQATTNLEQYLDQEIARAQQAMQEISQALHGREALDGQEALEGQIASLKTEVVVLEEWNKGIERFACKSDKPNVITQSLHTLKAVPTVTELIVGKIMGVSQELFKFLGKDYNWHGMGLRILDAYLKLPPLSDTRR